MHIAVDLDDVCMEFYGSVLKAVALEYGHEFDYEKCTSWDRNELKETDIFGTKVLAGRGDDGSDLVVPRTWWDWLQGRDWLWTTFPAVPGAIGSIDLLRRQGHYLEAVTKKPEWAEWTVWAWLGKWRPSFNRVTIVPSGQKKSMATDAHVLVDDSPDNIEDWSVNKKRPVIVFDRPWNREVLPGPNVLLAGGWTQVLHHLATIEEKRAV